MSRKSPGLSAFALEVLAFGSLALGSLVLGSLVTVAAASEPGAFAECESAYGDPLENGSEEAADLSDWNGCGCFYAVGTGRGLIPEATAKLQDLLEKHGDDACLRFNLGRLRMLVGSAEAEQLLASAASGYAEHGSAPGEVYARINLSRVLGSKGKDELARSQLELARRVARTAGDALLEAQVDLQQARADLARGRQLEEVECRFLGLAQRTAGMELPSLSRETWLGLGNVRYQLGWYEEAEAAYQRTAEICLQAGDPYGRATALQNAVIALVAQSAARQVDRSRIEELLRQALDAAVEAGQPFAEADASLRLGRMVGGDEGRMLVRRSLELAEQLEFSSVRTRALAALAVWQLESNSEPTSELEAARLAEQSRHFALASPHFGDGVDGWADRLDVSWQLAARQQLMAEMDAALGRIEQWRDQQGQDFGRAQVFAPWTEVYYALSGRLLRASQQADPDPLDLERAFGILERMRARVLLESLTASGVHQPQGETFDPDRVELERLQASLSERQVLLSFQVAPQTDAYGRFAGGSWLVAVTREAIRLYPIPDRRRLTVQVRSFLRLFPRRDGSQTQAAQRLHGELLSAAMADLPQSVEHLVVVPDGPLHRLPFPALVDEGERFLIESFELSVVPSATLWKWWQEGRRPAAAGRTMSALVLADPELNSRLNPELDPDAGSQLPTLPYARREGRSVLRSTAPGSRLWVGAEASRRPLVSEDLSPFGVVHLAAHAVIDERRPERSAVILASEQGFDARLNPAEIASLDLRQKLVVLSACQSTSGVVFAGEGTMSLARAFFKAGASAVVGSLWPVRDRDSAEFFDHFYRHLGRGTTVAEALAATQRDHAGRGLPAEHWAGWVVLGDGALAFASLGPLESLWAKLKPTSPALAIGIVAVVVAVFLGLLGLARRRSR